MSQKLLLLLLNGKGLRCFRFLNCLSFLRRSARCWLIAQGTSTPPVRPREVWTRPSGQKFYPKALVSEPTETLNVVCVLGRNFVRPETAML